MAKLAEEGPRWLAKVSYLHHGSYWKHVEVKVTGSDISVAVCRAVKEARKLIWENTRPVEIKGKMVKKRTRLVEVNVRVTRLPAVKAKAQPKETEG